MPSLPPQRAGQVGSAPRRVRGTFAPMACPESAPHTLGTTSQSSCRLGYIPTRRPISDPAITTAPAAIKSGGTCIRSAQSQTQSRIGSGRSAASSGATAGTPLGSGIASSQGGVTSGRLGCELLQLGDGVAMLVEPIRDILAMMSRHASGQAGQLLSGTRLHRRERRQWLPRRHRRYHPRLLRSPHAAHAAPRTHAPLSDPNSYSLGL